MSCKNSHYFNLLVNGFCWECKYVYMLGTPEQIRQRIAEMTQSERLHKIKEPNL